MRHHRGCVLKIAGYTYAVAMYSPRDRSLDDLKMAIRNRLICRDQLLPSQRLEDMAELHYFEENGKHGLVAVPRMILSSKEI